MNFKLSPVVIRWDNLVLTTQALVMGYRHGYGILEHTREPSRCRDARKQLKIGPGIKACPYYRRVAAWTFLGDRGEDDRHGG
jgi:hypothetical protein